MLHIRLLRTLGFGFGGTLAAMIVFPMVAKAARPVLKSVIKSGLTVTNQFKNAREENKENMGGAKKKKSNGKRGKGKKRLKIKD